MAERKIRVVRPADKVKVMFGAGDEYRFLATGEDTDGTYFLVEAVVPPGLRPWTRMSHRASAHSTPPSSWDMIHSVQGAPLPM